MCYKYQRMKTKRNWTLHSQDDSAAFEKLVKDITLLLQLLDRWRTSDQV